MNWKWFGLGISDDERLRSNDGTPVLPLVVDEPCYWMDVKRALLPQEDFFNELFICEFANEEACERFMSPVVYQRPRLGGTERNFLDRFIDLGIGLIEASLLCAFVSSRR